jgi:diguanylate cyclase (GGDEF)-like protein
MKKDAIEKLMKVDAKKTTQLVFEALYSAMERGWTRQDLKVIIERLQNVQKNISVDVYRSAVVSQKFGVIDENDIAISQNNYVQKALENHEILNIKDNAQIDYYYPLIAKQECLKCHTNAKQKDVLGVIAIAYPIDDLKVSLSSFINFFILFVLMFSATLFIALFLEFDRHLVRPIKNFIHSINLISNEKDISKRVTQHNNIQEIHSMQEVFNQMLDTLEYQFYNDDLTHLPNRKKLIEKIAENHSGVLMVLNIDKFQEVNDLYGDKIGNEVLISIANILKENIYDDAILFKLHADEYAVYYEDHLDYDEIKSFAAHLVQVIDNHMFTINHNDIFINITNGLAFGNENLLNNADIALRLAKKRKTKYLIYDSSMNIEHEYEQNLKWTKKIKDAIEEDRITPLFQPIVDAQTKKIVKYEALMRMKDHNGEYISPIHFLELAKKNKLYTRLTQIILKKSFETFKDSDLQVSVNLSVEDIMNEQVYKCIIDSLKQYNFKDRIVFEIIESEGIENFEEVHNFIQEVKTYGAKISIDDFGTGYSNFEYLMKLKVDYIKIDASMIKDIDTNHNSQMVTETIISFAQKMNIKTVAEFIHSQNVYDKVKEMGIDYGQGYFFGAPQEL